LSHLTILLFDPIYTHYIHLGFTQSEEIVLMASYQEVNERAELLKDATLGMKIASSLMNICGVSHSSPISNTSIDTQQHLQFLQNKGFYTEEHREFLDRAVLKFPGTAPLAEKYFLSTGDLVGLGVTFAAAPTGPAVRFTEPAATIIPDDNVTVKIEEHSVDEVIQVEEPVAVAHDEIEVSSMVERSRDKRS
jgi:hypothetical protein